MITFSCPTCEKPFNVPDTFAGRNARCKGCGRVLVVPAGGEASESARAPRLNAAATPTSAPARPPLRIRRLIADAASMTSAFHKHAQIRVESTEGRPPEKYRIAFSVKSLARDGKGRPAVRSEHLAEVQLGAEYPRMPPVCRMLTPVFHPNIDESHVCIGDHWTAGERLVDLVKRLGEMLAYQAYNIRSPLDGEAAMWADLNKDKLPTDPRPM